MALEGKYSFITVSSDDDDDVVIVAGASSQERAPEPAAGQAFESEGAPASEPALESVPEPAPASVPEPEPEPESSPAPAPAPAPAGKSKGAYRETTLEDLDAAPMGTTQKVIIAVAVLGVLAFVAYYLLFM